MPNRIAIIAVAVLITVAVRTAELQVIPGFRPRVCEALIGQVIHPLARPFARTSVFESAIVAAVHTVPDLVLGFVVFFALQPTAKARRRR